MYPQIGGPSLEKIALDYLSAGEEDDVEIEVIEEALAVFQTPRRWTRKGVKEKLDDSCLRRSRRISKKNDGFKDAECAMKIRQAEEQAAAEEEAVEATPLAIILGPPRMVLHPTSPRRS